MSTPRSILADASHTMKERRRLTERDMIEDAPPYYSPRWLDVLKDGPLKAMLRGSYMELREEVSGPKNRGVSLSQDLLIRRVVYLDRILSRVEFAMEYWTSMLSTDERAEDFLMKYAYIYSSNTNAMVSCIKQLGLAKPPHRKTIHAEVIKIGSN